MRLFYDRVISLLQRALIVTVPNISALTNAQLEAGLSQSQRNSLSGMTPQNTGLAVDDQYGCLVDFFTLKQNSRLFGNTNRFTNSAGNYVAFQGANLYMIDNHTGLGWYTNVISLSHNQATSASDAAAFTYNDSVLGILGGFRLPTINELLSIANWNQSKNGGISALQFGWDVTTVPNKGLLGFTTGLSGVLIWTQTPISDGNSTYWTYKKGVASAAVSIGQTINTTTTNMVCLGVRQHY